MVTRSLGALTSSVRKVTLQFSMSDGNQVPRWVMWIAPEKPSLRDSRKIVTPGEQFLFPDEDATGRDVNDVSLVGVVEDLIAANYLLVEAIAQKRLHHKNAGQSYAMVRYTFYRKEFALQSLEFLQHEAAIMRDLKEFLELALWRVRGFQNPYVDKDCNVLANTYAISINMEARNPLFIANDKSRPQVRWQTDAAGDRVGDAPLPLTAGCFVGTIGGEIGFLVHETAAE